MIIGILILGITYKSFPLTPLLYGLILVHFIILMIGGHYTYAEVPAFEFLKGAFGWTRNNYDKVGHFAQGFVPALIVREIVLRKNIINGSWWVLFFAVASCLAFSATYELFEWFVAVSTGESANAFLGTQGDIWDTQSDMAFALVGSITSLVGLGKIHDRQLSKLCT